ncbi:MAG: xanthine dehydrogenase family protein subunit M [Chloroflexota bacterium]
MKFNYLEPKTAAEAVSLLERYGGKAKVIAGGTDLVVQMRGKAARPEQVIDLEYVPGLNYLKYNRRQGLRLGAMTTIRSLETSPVVRKEYPIIAQAAGQLASGAIRNVATLGGNLCNAAPSAEMVPSLIALSAWAKVLGPGGERVLPLEDFFTGPGKTVLGQGELLVEVSVPPVPARTRGVYLKYSIRGSMDLAMVGVAVVMALGAGGKCREIRIVLGAVAPTPMRAGRAEAVIRGEKINATLIEQCANIAADEVHPRASSFRASPEYKKEIVKVFIRRALNLLVSDQVTS